MTLIVTHWSPEPVQLVHNFMTMYLMCTTMLGYNGTGRCKGVCFGEEGCV
jgi:tRNA(Met) C34 N-acetyltransferase TmcA